MTNTLNQEMIKAAPRSSFLTALLVALALFLPACGPTKVEAPRIDDADYIYPEPNVGEMTQGEEKVLRKAWNDVLTGQTGRAQESIDKLLAESPELVPARVVLGFAALRADQLSDAESTFVSALSRQPENVSALAGLAAVKRKTGAIDEALPLYMKADRLRPRDPALTRRISEMKLSVAEAAIGRAMSLAAEGRKPEAIRMLQRALEVAPELSPVRLELANLLLEEGRRSEALEVLGAAHDADRNIALRIAILRMEDGDLDGAETALKRGLINVAEDAEGAGLLAQIRERRASLALPEPLRVIGDAPRVTRAELAALVVVRVDALKSKKPAGMGRVASDLSRTWARPQIIRVIELGLMDVYPNHTFQPSGVVRRGELAVVAARVLDHVGWGRSNGTPPRDMSPSHLQYSSVVRVVGAGVMQNTAAGAFEPWRIVSGAEAKSVVEALARLSAQR